MPEFSACYFCGTALDAPLAEYPVVPETLHPSADQQRTVVLCPSCRRKLGAVVDAVVGAVDDAPSDASIQQDLDAAGNGASEGATGDHDAEDDDGISVEAVDDHRAVAEPTDEPAAADDGDEFEEAGDDRGEIEEAAVAADADHEMDAVDDGATTDDGMAADTAQDADETTVEGGEPADEEGPADDGEPVDDGKPVDDGEPTNEDEPQLTALEYNKVMRLLQNRDFPVDHEEFKIVATNAYEISDDEFDAIIEAAAERDLIGLDSGNIVES